MQNANDTAVLFATREFQITKQVPSSADVERFLKGNLAGAVISNVNISFDEANNVMTLTSDSVSKPVLMNYFDNQSTKVSVLSRAKLGVSGILEFSLALDTTLSMNDNGRMAALKVSANNFVKLLFDKKDSGADVRGSIVPFAQYVNVGMGRRNASWMDVPADIDTRSTRQVSNTTTPQIGTTNCRNVTVAGYTQNIAAVPSTCSFSDGFQKCTVAKPASSKWIPAKTTWTCDPVFGPPVTTTVTQNTGSLTAWQGCVSSRATPDNVKDPFGNHKFPGVLGTSCTAELLPLTDNRVLLTAKINALTPLHNTYIPDGIMWGMRTLTPAEPFTEGKAAAAGSTQPLRKALLIMTDGQNSIRPTINNNTNLSPNKILHTNVPNNPFDSSVPDVLTILACNEAKAAGIEVYTISFGDQVPGPTRTMLESCASKVNFYSHASDSIGLAQAFNDVADNLLGVRLSE